MNRVEIHPILVGVVAGIMYYYTNEVWGSPNGWIIAGVIIMICFIDSVWEQRQDSIEWQKYKKRYENELIQRRKAIAGGDTGKTLDEFHKELVDEYFKKDK